MGGRYSLATSGVRSDARDRRQVYADAACASGAARLTRTLTSTREPSRGTYMDDGIATLAASDSFGGANNSWAIFDAFFRGMLSYLR